MKRATYLWLCDTLMYFVQLALVPVAFFRLVCMPSVRLSSTMDVTYGAHAWMAKKFGYTSQECLERLIFH